MNDTIVCPYCKKSFPVTETLKHQVKDEVRIEFEKQEKPIMWKKALAAAGERMKEAAGKETKLLKDQLEEERKKRDEAEKNELVLRKERAEFEEEKKQQELIIQRKVDAERKKISDETHLKDLEHQKKEADYLKQIEELKQKMQQGSQQLQGEVQELELESILRREFPYDEIKEVPKGVRGADVLQVVRNNYGKTVGMIIWESKRTKAWTDSWISKLKQDQRVVKADIAIIISQVLPTGIKNLSQIDGVWVVSFNSIIELGLILRSSLLEVFGVRSSAIGKQEKKEILWSYLTSIEFRQRLEAIHDAIKLSGEYLEKEKEFFRRKWAREEKTNQLMQEHLLGMHGDLQAIIGKSLPEMKDIGLLPTSEHSDIKYEK